MCNQGFAGGNCCWIILVIILLVCCCGGQQGGCGSICGTANNLSLIHISSDIRWA